MYKVRLVVAACLAMATFGTLASTSASAASPGWMENGRTLLAGEVLKIAEPATVLKTFELAGVGTNIKITCTTLKIKNGTITGLALALAESLVFGGCRSAQPCEIASETIATVPLLTHEVTLDGTLAAKATFIPQTKSVFATFKFVLNECALGGVVTVKGRATFIAPTLQDERTEQQLEAAIEAGELEIGSFDATITGAADLLLESHLPWSFL